MNSSPAIVSTRRERISDRTRLDMGTLKLYNLIISISIYKISLKRCLTSDHSYRIKNNPFVKNGNNEQMNSAVNNKLNRIRTLKYIYIFGFGECVRNGHLNYLRALKI